MAQLDQEARESFFRKARELPPVTLGAIDRLLALGADERIHIEFTMNKKDDALLVTIPTADSKAALFKVESTGRLMLLLAKQPRAQVRRALKELAECFDSRLPHDWSSTWEKRLPTSSRGEWERRTDRIREVVEALANGGDVVSAAKGFRQRRNAGRGIAEPLGTGRSPRQTEVAGAGASAETRNDSQPAPTSAEPAPRPVPIRESPLERASTVEGSPPVAPGLTETEIASLAATILDERVKRGVMRWARSSQSKFRSNLYCAYEGACCVSGCEIDDVLEAAHIEDHAVNGDCTTPNGLLLRSDLHALFDAGLLRLDPETYTVRLDARLLPWHGDFEGKRIRLPADKRLWPSREKLTAKSGNG